jgi:hypothetical protein
VGDVGPGLLHHWDVEVADVDQYARPHPRFRTGTPCAMMRHTGTRPARPSLA